MKDTRTIAKRIIFTLLLLVVIGWYSFPVYWTLITSFKTPLDLMSSRPIFFPQKITLSSYEDIFLRSKFPYYLRSSMIIASMVTIITLVLATGAAYSLSRLNFRGKRLFSNLILLVYLFPGILLVVPIFKMMTTIGLYDLLPSVILVHVTITLPFCIWTLSTFFDQIPPSLEDAARVDGATKLSVLYKLYLPLIRPGLVTSAIFSFVASWNEYIFPLILLSTPEKKTIPVGIAGWASSYTIDWGQITAAVILAIIPVIILIQLIGRRFVAGLSG
ncbi:MAG: carbohydrate ABC transporter permease, partial [Thermoplasmata archaeon]|nr:carbohydrate ABC transporter permease [Thermoplasmata archaeon]